MGQILYEDPLVPLALLCVRDHGLHACCQVGPAGGVLGAEDGGQGFAVVRACQALEEGGAEVGLGVVVYHLAFFEVFGECPFTLFGERDPSLIWGSAFLFGL